MLFEMPSINLLIVCLTAVALTWLFLVYSANEAKAHVHEWKKSGSSEVLPPQAFQPKRQRQYFTCTGCLATTFTDSPV